MRLSAPKTDAISIIMLRAQDGRARYAARQFETARGATATDII